MEDWLPIPGFLKTLHHDYEFLNDDDRVEPSNNQHQTVYEFSQFPALSNYLMDTS